MNVNRVGYVTRNRPVTTSLLLVAILFLAQCGPSPRPKSQVTEESHRTVEHARPVDLQLIPGDGKMIVQWRVVSSEITSGYDIFISEQPVSPTDLTKPGNPVKPFNPEVYPGDTNPDDSVEQYSAENLKNGVKYYVWVRIVRPDGTFSEPTGSKTAVCGPRGEFDLGLRYQSDDDGYSLAKNKSVRADAADNDLYFFRKDGVDYLASPTRLNAYLRATKLIPLNLKGDLNQVRKRLATLTEATADDRVPISDGVWVRLVTAEGANALIHVLSIKGKEVRLSYALCPLAGEMSF